MHGILYFPTDKNVSKLHDFFAVFHSCGSEPQPKANPSVLGLSLGGPGNTCSPHSSAMVYAGSREISKN